jgi:hypothetical protein
MSTEDTVIPNFKLRSQKGEVFFNPYSHSETVFTESPVAFVNHYHDNGDMPSGGGFLDYGTLTMDSCLLGMNRFLEPPSDLPSTNEAHSAINSAYAGVAAGSAHLLETAAEIRESLATLQSYVRKARRFLDLGAYFNKMARKKKGGARVPFKDVASEWLEYRYGLRPIMFDVNNIMKALNKGIPVRFTSRGFGEAAPYEQSDSTLNTAPFSSMNVIVTRSLTVSRSYRASVLASLPSGILSWGHNFGLDEWVETAWELVPYSFVIDWFIGVGTYLSSITPNFGVKELGGCLVSITETRQQTVCTLVDDPSYQATAAGRFRNVSGSGSTTRVATTKHRAVGITPSVRGAVGRVNLDTAKVVDLAALIVTRKSTEGPSGPLIAVQSAIIIPTKDK